MRQHWNNPDIQAELAAKSAMGMSASQIARDLGTSKAAVASAMTRYGLCASSQPGRKKSVSLQGYGSWYNAH